MPDMVNKVIFIWKFKAQRRRHMAWDVALLALMWIISREKGSGRL